MDLEIIRRKLQVIGANLPTESRGTFVLTESYVLMAIEALNRIAVPDPDAAAFSP